MVFSPFTIKHENLQGFRLLVNPVFSLILQKSSFFSCFTTKSLLLYLEIIASDMRVLPCKPLVRLPRSSVLRPIHHLFRASPLTPLPPPIYTISNQSGIKPMYKLLSLFILIAILFLILNHCRNQQQGVFRLKIG